MDDEQQVRSENRENASSVEGSVDQGFLGNIPVSISVELGKARLKIGDLMTLNQGSVVSLDTLAGEPLNLRVNNTLIAIGEIVLIENHYGLKLTQIVPSEERL